jgi:hypothetical protein
MNITEIVHNNMEDGEKFPAYWAGWGNQKIYRPP